MKRLAADRLPVPTSQPEFIQTRPHLLYRVQAGGEQFKGLRDQWCSCWVWQESLASPAVTSIHISERCFEGPTARLKARFHSRETSLATQSVFEFCLTRHDALEKLV